MACSSGRPVSRPTGEMGEGPSAPPAYPFLVPGLQSPLGALAREDGQEIYKIALKNDRILRSEYERSMDYKAICGCGDDLCRSDRLSRLEVRLKAREHAWRRQLAIRLDAMEYSVASYEARTNSREAGPIFNRYRLLIETLSDERMAILRRELIQGGHSCKADWSFQSPAGAFFLPYYTAWFRFYRDLPSALRKEFFTDRGDLPK